MTTSAPIKESVTLAGAPDAAAGGDAAARGGTGVVGGVLGVVLFLTMLPVTMMVPVLKELVAERYATTPFWTHSFMSVNMIAAVLAAPVAGLVADRMARRKPILLWSLVANAVLLLLMAHAGSFAVLLGIRFLEGAAHIIAVSTVMACASDWAGPRHRGRMMGLIGSMLMLGTACGAPLGGRVGEHHALWVFYLGSGFSALAAVVSVCLVSDAPALRRMGRLRETLATMRHYRRLWVPYAYAFIDRFCVGVIVSTFVLYLGAAHGLSPTQRGGLLALFMFPFALLCYPVGRLTDRFGRALAMCFGSLAFGCVFAAYAFVPTDALWIAMLASGVLSAIMFAPNLALCADLAPDGLRASSYAGFNVAGSVGFIVGPLAGGLTCQVLAGSMGAVSAQRAALGVAGATEIVCALATLPWLLRLRRAGVVT